MKTLLNILFMPAVLLNTYGYRLESPTYQNQIPTSPRPFDVKVPVRLGVMSRCPDALTCESLFDNVVKRVGDKIDLALVYVAK